MNDSFSKCLADICGLELSALTGSCKYSVFGGHTFVLEGHKGIADYSRETVSFKTDKNSVIRVTGDKLSIKCIEKNFVVINGRIDKIEAVRNEK